MSDEPRLSPALGHPIAERLRDELAQGRWQGTAEVLGACRNWDERAFLVAAVSEWPGRPAWLDEWFHARGRASTLPALVRGAHSIQWAWEARGSGTGGTVTRDAGALFLSRLDAAERDLMEAAQGDPDDPTPWALLITTAMGRNLGAGVVAKRFAQATQRDVDHRAAHVAMLSASTEKWGGSHDAMFRFAREAAGRAARGSSLHALVPLAHVERWLAHLIDRDQDGAKAYVTGAAVRAELLAARDALLGAPLLAPAYEASDRNILAFALWLAGDTAAAAEQLRALGTRVARQPWQFMGDAVRGFVRARAQCLGIGEAAVEEEVRRLCETCVKHTRDSHGTELDFGWPSLARVDGLLRGYAAALAKEKRTSEEAAALVGLARMYGAYAGEVVRRQAGGCWIAVATAGVEPAMPALIREQGGVFPAVVTALGILLGRPTTTLEAAANEWLGRKEEAPGAPAPPPAPAGIPPEKMVSSAEHFARTLRESGIGALKFDAASLAVLDRYLPEMRRGLAALQGDARRRTEALMALSLGAYLGETLRRSAGGVWRPGPPGPAAEVPVVDMGVATAAVVPAALGFLLDNAVSLGDTAVRTPSEYVRALSERQRAWITTRVCGTATPQELAASLSRDRSLGDRLVNVLGTALSTATLKWGLDLDFSEASLEGLDRLLLELHKAYRDSDPKPTEEQVATMTACWGIYFGEVLRRHLGGKWVEAPLQGQDKVLRLELGARTLFPTQHVRRSIEEGTARSLSSSYQFQAGVTGDAAAAGEVPEALQRFAAEVVRIAVTLLPTDGKPLSPFLLSQKGGANSIESYVMLSSNKALPYGRRRAAEQPAEVQFVALVYDGYLGDGRSPMTDAIMVEAHGRGLPSGFLFGHRYRVAAGVAQAVGTMEVLGACRPYLKTAGA